jgi:hypothetical protein
MYNPALIPAEAGGLVFVGTMPAELAFYTELRTKEELQQALRGAGKLPPVRRFANEKDAIAAAKMAGGESVKPPGGRIVCLK